MGKVVLEKIILKNWHAFEDNEFDISALSSLITGMNASGKTTLLDAISVILDSANSHDFNVAVKDEGERRTISGALHYVVSGEPLRTGKVTGLIMAQFYDENYNVRFLNGVYLISKSYSSDSMIDQRYFSVNNMSVDSPGFRVDFEKCKIPGQVNYPNKKTAFEEFFRLRKMQHIKPEIYKGLINSVLKAKLDCSPADFVRKNILPEDEKVKSIEAIKNNYKLLDEKEKLYEELSEEANFLKRIRTNWFELKSSESDYATLALAKQRVLKEQLLLLNKDKEELGRSILDIKSKKNRLEDNLSKLSMKLGEYKSKDIVLEKKKEIAMVNRELLTMKTELERINKTLQNMNELANTISVKIRLTKDSPEEEITALLNTAESYIEQADETILSLREQAQTIKKEITGQNESLSQLRKGTFVISNASGIGARILAAKELVKLINHEFSANGIDDTAALLFELVDCVKEPSWQPAIESLVGGRRIHVVVKPENEKKAIEIQSKSVLKADTDIILSSKLKRVKVSPNSVADMIKTKSLVAKHIIGSYYGFYTLCNTMDEYHSCDYAIMKNGMHKNRVSSRKLIKPLAKNDLLIGNNGAGNLSEMESQLSILKKQEKTVIDELNAANVEKKKVSNLLSTVRAYLPVNVFICEEYSDKVKQLRELQEEIVELAKSSKVGLTDTIGEEIKEIKAKIASMSKSNDAMISESIKKEEAISKLTKASLDFEKQFLTIDSSNVTDEQVESALSSMNGDQKNIDELTKKQNSLLGKGKSISSNIKVLQTEYNLKFNPGQSLKVGIETDTYNSYAKRLIYLEGKAFIEIVDEIKHLKKALTESKAGVFKAIAESFKYAENEVEKINSILKKYEISGNCFKIHLGPLLRKKDLYSAILEFANEEHVSKAILERLDDCFQKMINSKDTNVFLDLADYRNYLDCDVMISHIETKTWKSFSSEKGSFSGGQKETPYYMCLAAALSCKAYTTSGLRLIVLDEAFKNMDPINKVKALSMFQNLNLQILLFTSNSDLTDCTDHIYVISKFDNRIITAFGKNKDAIKVIDKRIKIS